ncbi:hypothetical protein PAH45_03035 [Klebsiella quasipneumoniae]|uniref:hypothetical protein n=1 Tax=Klebsiella quasipneumoniae TaxID=1463165 RepID=UPI000A1CB089|nr:hypothetical protein [Klebsiella quasipneumoniae]HBQ6650712.1 hypothetical protein [Klebsiella quasipneumoniae subsp. quasipneumoniae]MCU8820471.1 hypothetical protein [Klebsiella quasipneumoniae]MDH1958245.1 hypothetical protein [Klebsiella quasipneumoniae]MDR4840772.1 hypothetical protein [Klebsiella quasipneumoniae]MDV5430109.1 hypothetical protein [Klebsiella quasipneumoniae]
MHVNVYVGKSGRCFTDLLKKLSLFNFQVLLPSTLFVSSRLLTSEYKLRDLDQVLALLIPFSWLLFDRFDQV